MLITKIGVIRDKDIAATMIEGHMDKTDGVNETRNSITSMRNERKNLPMLSKGKSLSL